MICPKCGSTIEGGYRYVTCPNCGRTFDSTKLENEEKPAQRFVPQPEPEPESLYELEPSSLLGPEPATTPTLPSAPETEPIHASSLSSVPETTPEPIPVLETLTDSDSALEPKQTPALESIFLPEPTTACDSSTEPDLIPASDSIPKQEQILVIEPLSAPDHTTEPKPTSPLEHTPESAPERVSTAEFVDKPVPGNSSRIKKPWILAAVFSFCCIVGMIIFLLSNSHPSSTNQIQDTSFTQKTQAYTNDENLEIVGEYKENSKHYVLVRNNYEYPVDIKADSHNHTVYYYAANPDQEVVIEYDNINDISAKKSDYKGLNLQFENEYKFNKICNCYISCQNGDIDSSEQVGLFAVFLNDGGIVAVEEESYEYVKIPYLKEHQKIPVSIAAPVSNYDEIRWCFGNRRIPGIYFDDDKIINSNPEEVLKHISAIIYESDNRSKLLKLSNNSSFNLGLRGYVSFFDDNNNLIYSESILVNRLISGSSCIESFNYSYLDVIKSSEREELLLYPVESISDNAGVGDSLKDLVIENKTDRSVSVKNVGSVEHSWYLGYAALFFNNDQLVDWNIGSETVLFHPGGSYTINLDSEYDIDPHDRVEWYVYDAF